MTDETTRSPASCYYCERFSSTCPNCAELDKLRAENAALKAEMEFYRGLTVSRDDGTTAIDGGKTAEKLDVLWRKAEENATLRDVKAQMQETFEATLSSAQKEATALREEADFAAGKVTELEIKVIALREALEHVEAVLTVEHRLTQKQALWLLEKVRTALGLSDVRSAGAPCACQFDRHGQLIGASECRAHQQERERTEHVLRRARGALNKIDSYPATRIVGEIDSVLSKQPPDHSTACPACGEFGANHTCKPAESDSE